MSKIPYGRQYIDDDDISAVIEALRSEYLTTGPWVDKFEDSIVRYCGAAHGIAVSNGTAALHATMHAIGIKPGDEVIVPPLTFAATANCVLYAGAKPVFADVLADNLLIDPAQVESLITEKTRAIIGVDYAGHPCDWQALRQLSNQYNLALIADGCHALGASLGNQAVGTLADMTVFSFHPVKHITTGEGGIIVTDNDDLARKLRIFRNHGITTDANQRERAGDWFYEMRELGYNYRLTDIQAALGASQMKKLPNFLEKRRRIAKKYDAAFKGSNIKPLVCGNNVNHAYHLYVAKVQNRNHVFSSLREKGIGAQVHYIPVHLHPYYKETLGTSVGMCPIAEKAYEEIISLPIHQKLSDADFDYVVATMNSTIIG